MSIRVVVIMMWCMWITFVKFISSLFLFDFVFIWSRHTIVYIRKKSERNCCLLAAWLRIVGKHLSRVIRPANYFQSCVFHLPMPSKTKCRIIVENVVRTYGYNINNAVSVGDRASVDDVRPRASAKETCALLAACEACDPSTVFASRYYSPVSE